MAYNYINTVTEKYGKDGYSGDMLESQVRLCIDQVIEQNWNRYTITKLIQKFPVPVDSMASYLVQYPHNEFLSNLHIAAIVDNYKKDLLAFIEELPAEELSKYFIVTVQEHPHFKVSITVRFTSRTVEDLILKGTLNPASIWK